MKPQPGRPSWDSTLESIGVAIVLALVVSIVVAVTGGAYVMSAIEIEVELDQQEAEAWGTILVIYFVVSYAVAEIWEWFESVFSPTFNTLDLQHAYTGWLTRISESRI